MSFNHTEIIHRGISNNKLDTEKQKTSVVTTKINTQMLRDFQVKLQEREYDKDCLLLELYHKLSAIWVLVAQWLEHLTGDQKVAGSIPVWVSEAFFWVCDKAWVANSFPLIYQTASHLKYIYIY